MIRHFSVIFTLLAGAAHADPVSRVMSAAEQAFADMPQLRVVDQIAGRCGAGFDVNQQVAYCTTLNEIYLAQGAQALSQAPYLVAHLLGHAVQVQHGVADVALREIRARRDEEAVLRGYVASQVDCLAGVFFALADLPKADLTDWFDAEPFGGTHWGRDPLQVGPQVSIGLAERNAWFLRGQSAGDVAVCAAGEFGSDLLVKAYRAHINQ